MPSASAIGKGFTFKRGDAASPEVFTTVAEIVSIGAFGAKRPAVESTNLDSQQDDFVSGFLGGGEITLEVNFLPDNATQGLGTGLALDLQNGTRRNFKITSNTTLGAKSWTLTGYVTDWKGGPVSSKEKVAGSFKIQVVEGSAWTTNYTAPFGYA